METDVQTNDILGKGAFKTVYKGFDGLEGLGEPSCFHNMCVLLCFSTGYRAQYLLSHTNSILINFLRHSFCRQRWPGTRFE